MLDKPEKTFGLIAALKAAAPFEVELPLYLIDHLRAQRGVLHLEPRQIVSDIFYAGDEGGILCRIEPENGKEALFVSITYLCVRRPLPFAAAVLDYQKHRVKKLRKQHAADPDAGRQLTL